MRRVSENAPPLCAGPTVRPPPAQGFYYVLTRDANILACAMLKRYALDCAELGTRSPHASHPPPTPTPNPTQCAMPQPLPEHKPKTPTRTPTEPLPNGPAPRLGRPHCFCGAGCLVVSPRYRKEGRGDSMLSFLERTAISAGVSRLFALSTRTMQWFTERGFVEVPVSELPERRQRTINPARGSKVFMKGLNSPRELDAEELFWAADAPQSRQARGG